MTPHLPLVSPRQRKVFEVRPPLPQAGCIGIIIGIIIGISIGIAISIAISMAIAIIAIIAIVEVRIVPFVMSKVIFNEVARPRLFSEGCGEDVRSGLG